MKPALGQVLAGRLDRSQLATYYAAKMRGSKKARPLAETTVAHHHAMLKTAYNWALEEELLLVNPTMRVKNPPALRPKVRPVWSMEEIARTVIRARGLQVHAAGVLAGFSSLRVGEVAGLLWSDLDRDRGFVNVCRTIEEHEHRPNGTLRQMRLLSSTSAVAAGLRQRSPCRVTGGSWRIGRVVPEQSARLFVSLETPVATGFSQREWAIRVRSRP